MVRTLTLSFPYGTYRYDHRTNIYTLRYHSLSDKCLCWSIVVDVSELPVCIGVSLLLDIVARVGVCVTARVVALGVSVLSIKVSMLATTVRLGPALVSVPDETSPAPRVVVCDVTVPSPVLGVTGEMDISITLVINVVSVVTLDVSVVLSIVTEGTG